MAPSAGRPMTRSNSVKNAVTVRKTGAGKEDDEDDALPADDSPAEEPSSEEEPDADPGLGSGTQIIRMPLGIMARQCE